MAYIASPTLILLELSRYAVFTLIQSKKNKFRDEEKTYVQYNNINNKTRTQAQKNWKKKKQTDD